MKPRQLLPPIIALIAGCGWLSYQAAERNRLVNSTAALRERIAVAKRTAGEDAPRSLAEQRARASKTTAGGKVISAEMREWQQFAEMQLDGETDGMQNLRLNLRMQSRLKKMTAEEILATYDELAASDLSREGLAKIETMFFDAAADKDPEMTMRHFEHTLAAGEFPMADRLGNAFSKWLGKDKATAIAWLDEMTSAGNFDTKRLDGVNQTLTRCVGPVIASLLDSDPADALARLQALPESQRGVVIGWNFETLKPGTELAYAALVRQGLPEAERASGFSRVANQMALDGGFAKVSSFLDTIGASAAERQETAIKVATPAVLRLLRTDSQIDGVHDWLVQQSPQTADRDMGRALISNLNHLGAEKTLAAVHELYAKTASDQLLEGFLNSRATGPLGEDAMALANQIKDPALRERMQHKIRLETTK